MQHSSSSSSSSSSFNPQARHASSSSSSSHPPHHNALPVSIAALSHRTASAFYMPMILFAIRTLIVNGEDNADVRGLDDAHYGSIASWKTRLQDNFNRYSNLIIQNYFHNDSNAASVVYDEAQRSQHDGFPHLSGERQEEILNDAGLLHDTQFLVDSNTWCFNNHNNNSDVRIGDALDDIHLQQVIAASLIESSSSDPDVQLL